MPTILIYHYTRFCSYLGR